MKVPGDRGKCVTIKLLRQEMYDRIRPQGRRRFCANQPFGGEYGRDARERDRQPGPLSQRRGGARGTGTLVEGVADSGHEVDGVCELPGSGAREKFLSAIPARHNSSRQNALSSLFLVLTLISLAGCGAHKKVRTQAPAPPPLVAPVPQVPAPVGPPVVAGKEKEDEHEKIEAPAGAKAIFEESGMASWYGAPYHNRRGSNGEVYNMNAMTAAHRTLPLGSIVRVTNVKTGHAAVVRITDRGPFVEGRILDLSLAAAKALDVYLPGVAKIRLEVLQVPLPIDTGGRWAVQIGSFAGEKNASELAEHLQRRYRSAKVLRFASPIGDWWVRVRVRDDDRERAQTVARETATREGSVFLVRLD